LPHGNLFCLIHQILSFFCVLKNISMSKPAPKLMTQQELLDLPDDHMRHELIKGELITMPLAGCEHGQIALWIGRLLGTHIAKNKLGCSFGAGTGFLIERDPDTVRAPDFAFVAKNSTKPRTPKGFFPGAPDLAVEVISPDDCVMEVEDKIQQWLDAGCQSVWVVKPTRQTITIHQNNAQPQVLHPADDIHAPDLLPGFQAKVKDLFPPRK
jgi:Uma2 family endonuclease